MTTRTDVEIQRLRDQDELTTAEETLIETCLNSVPAKRREGCAPDSSVVGDLPITGCRQTRASVAVRGNRSTVRPLDQSKKGRARPWVGALERLVGAVRSKAYM